MDNCIIIICACELIMVKVNIYKIMSISQIVSSYLLEHKTHLSHIENNAPSMLKILGDEMAEASV